MVIVATYHVVGDFPPGFWCWFSVDWLRGCFISLRTLEAETLDGIRIDSYSGGILSITMDGL